MVLGVRGRGGVLVALSLLAGACTGDYSSEPTTTVHPPTSEVPTTPPSTPPPDPGDPGPGDQDLVIELGGTLAVTVENLVVTVSPDGSQVDLVDGGPDGIASQPVWSPDGSRLAWAHVGPEGESVGIRSEDGDLTYSTAVGAVPFYLQWNSTGQRLAYLRSTPAPAVGEEDGENPGGGDGGVDGGIGGVEAGLIEPGQPVVPLTSGSPFYLSWAPNRDELIALRNGSELMYLSQDAGALVLPEGGGPYTAPVWSSEVTVIVSDADSIDELNIESGERRQLAAVPGRVRFVLSPDRQRLAYSPSSDGLLPSAQDELIIVDIASGEDHVVATGLLLAWEWSPDSEILAWLAPGSSPEIGLVALQRHQFVWSFWKDGIVEEGAPYLPSDVAAQAYLPFFEQFSQSHKRWSPGSKAFAYAGSIDGFDGIWVQVVGHAEEPVYLTPGDAVTWGPADPVGGGSSVL